MSKVHALCVEVSLILYDVVSSLQQLRIWEHLPHPTTSSCPQKGNFTVRDYNVLTMHLNMHQPKPLDKLLYKGHFNLKEVVPFLQKPHPLNVEMPVCHNFTDGMTDWPPKSMGQSIILNC